MSGLEWTSLRASSFASNTLQAWGAQIRAGDVVRHVYAAFEESLIHERDLAEVGARALEIPPDVAKQGMVARGFPEPFVAALMARYAKHVQHAQHPTTDEVEKVLGRAAFTHAEWVAEHVDEFHN